MRLDLEKLGSWLEEQDPEEEYLGGDPTRCVVAKFLYPQGYTYKGGILQPDGTVYSVYAKGEEDTVEFFYNERYTRYIFFAWPWTLGAVLQRLRDWRKSQR